MAARQKTSISDQLAEVSQLIRSPTARDAAGELTAIGQAGGERLSAILDGLSDAKAETPDDALALAQLAFSFMALVALKIGEDDPARPELCLMAVSLNRLRDCLSRLSNRSPEDFDVSMLPSRPALH